MSGIAEAIQTAIQQALRQIPELQSESDKTKNGLSKNEVSHLISNASTDEKECSICLDSFNVEDVILFPKSSSGSTYTAKNDGDHFPVKLPCDHIFGFSCLREWLQIHNQCPLCRKEFTFERVSFDYTLSSINIPLHWTQKPNNDNDPGFLMPSTSDGVSYAYKKTSLY